MATRYTDEEAKEILRRAMAREGDQTGRLHHEDLVEAAAEVGISPELVEQAAADLQEEREARAIVDRRLAARKRAFYRHLGVFAIINAFIFVIDLMTGGGFWFQWPLVVWGLFVALRAYRALLPPGEAELDKHMSRERRRLARRREIAEKERARRERKQRRKRAEREFEIAVEGGVTALLEAIGKHLGPTTASRPRRGSRPQPPPPPPRQTGFDRYVSKRKSHGGHAPPTAPVVTPPPPPVRVDTREEHELEQPVDADHARQRRRR